MMHRSIGTTPSRAYLSGMKKLARLIHTTKRPTRERAPEAELRCEAKKAVEARAQADRGETMSPEGMREFMEALERGDAVPSFPHRR